MEKRIAVVLGLCAIWLGLCLAGMGVLVNYSNGQGAAFEIPQRNPNSETESDRFTLLMFVHPKCPCSRASVSELARLMTRCSEQIDATVYFYQPLSQETTWAKTSLWQMVQRIPHLRMEVDVDGAVAKQFGAATSGHVILYRADGELAYSGGITAGRGHEGDNTGRASVTALAEGRTPKRNRMPVFGCPIFK